MSSAIKMTFKAYDDDLNGKQFHAVKMAGDLIVDFSTAATDLSIGVLNNNPRAAEGAECEVVMVGPCKAKAGGTIAEGQFVVPNSAGEVVAVTLGTTTTNVAVGRALQDMADHDILEIFVNPGFVQV
jgi:hypothetical protein